MDELAGVLGDPDKDGIPWARDNCPWVKNLNQADSDQDGIGNACMVDFDGDGIADDSDACPRSPGESCSSEDTEVSLLGILEGVSELLGSLEETDLGFLAPYEGVLKEIGEELAEGPLLLQDVWKRGCIRHFLKMTGLNSRG